MKNNTLNEDYQSLNHCKFFLGYHVVLVTRQRKKLLSSAAVANALPPKFAELLGKVGCGLLACNVQADHVHLLITGTPKICLSDVLEYIKGNSARYARQYFPEVRQLPHLWSKSYFVRSVDNAHGGIEKVKKYINNQ